MFTIRPQPASIMSGSTAWQQWKVPVRLTANRRFHVSALMSRKGWKPSIPALLTRMVTGPNVSCTSDRPRSMSARSDTSTLKPLAVAPSALILLASTSAPSPFKSKIATFSPSCASRREIPRPIPEAPPVTIATFSIDDSDM